MKLVKTSSLVVAGVAALGCIAWGILHSTLQSSRNGNVERPACTFLKSLAYASADYRSNDRDGNGIQDFWRKDVSGLFALRGKDGQPIKLIEQSLALADERPIMDLSTYGRRRAKEGYWLRAIRKKGEPPVDALTQFAFCAFPAKYDPHDSQSRYTFVVDENNTVFRADLGQGHGVDTFPDDQERSQHWSKID